MKLKCILLSIFLCFSLIGCSSSDEKLINNDSGETVTEDTTDVKKDKEVLPDWSNWTKSSLNYPYGGAINLVADENKSIMTTDSVKVIDGKLTVYANYVNSLDYYEYDGSFKSTVVVIVNGKVCDFELDGMKSSMGRMIFEHEYGTEYLEKLTVSDCDFIKGENTISVLCANYYPQIGHSIGLYVTKNFYSDTEKTQSSTLTLNASELTGAEFVNGKIAPVASSDFIYEQILFDSSKRCTTVPQNGVSGIKQINALPGNTKTLDRNVICLVMKNGELLPAWNGSELLQIEFTTDIISASLPITNTIENGEYALLSYFMFDIENDNFIPTDRLFYGEKPE